MTSLLVKLLLDRIIAVETERKSTAQMSRVLFESNFDVLEADEFDGSHLSKVMPMVPVMGIYEPFVGQSNSMRPFFPVA